MGSGRDVDPLRAVAGERAGGESVLGRKVWPESCRQGRRGGGQGGRWQITRIGMCEHSPAGRDGELVFVLVVGDGDDRAAILVYHSQTLKLGCTHINLFKVLLGYKNILR